MPRKPAIASSKRAVAARLQREDRERDDRGDQAGGERRHAEEQVERDRRADELGEVGRDRDRSPPAPTGPSVTGRGKCSRQSSGRFGRWRCRSWPTGTGRASPSGSRRRSPTPACSRTWRRRRCSWRSCRGRCTRRRRRRPGRTARAATARGARQRAARRALQREALALLTRRAVVGSTSELWHAKNVFQVIGNTGPDLECRCVSGRPARAGARGRGLRGAGSRCSGPRSSPPSPTSTPATSPPTSPAAPSTASCSSG